MTQLQNTAFYFKNSCQNRPQDSMQVWEQSMLFCTASETLEKEQVARTVVTAKQRASALCTWASMQWPSLSSSGVYYCECFVLILSAWYLNLTFPLVEKLLLKGINYNGNEWLLILLSPRSKKIRLVICLEEGIGLQAFKNSEENIYILLYTVLLVNISNPLR